MGGKHDGKDGAGHLAGIVSPRTERIDHEHVVHDDGALGNPQMATAEIGRDLCEAAIRKIAEFAKDFIKG